MGSLEFIPMTHDELLAKVKETGLVAKNIITGNWVYEPQIEALRAVVELHKPDDSFASSVYCICEERYPCPTIQAIEKELL